MSIGSVTISKDREKPVLNQHPWIFSRAIVHAENAVAGELVKVMSQRGQFLAIGYWNPRSQIQVRLLSWQDEAIDNAWWRRKIEHAITLRQPLASAENAAYRLINAENDFLPGLVVDRYGDYLVLQALTLYIDKHKQEIARILADLTQVRGIYERSDVDVRLKEGLKETKGLLWGEEPPDKITIVEDGILTEVDVRTGHKTGAYLDQRDNRSILKNLIQQIHSQKQEQPISVLNMFSYVGGAGLSALDGGASLVVNVDSSHEALSAAERNLSHNPSLTLAGQAEFVQADAFQYLRDVALQSKQFDIVFLDPPKFAFNKQQVDKAARGYKDLNLNAFKLIKSGGYLLTFSCSGAIDLDLFQKIVFGALADSGRQAQLLHILGPGVDHPVALTFPEGAYLKGLMLRVI